MFTNTNIHDELGDDFTGATAMSNAEVKLALAQYRAQAPNKKRQSETFVRAEKHTKRVAQSNDIQTNQIRSVLEQTGFSHFEKAQLANFCPPRDPARPQTADLNDAVDEVKTLIPTLAKKPDQHLADAQLEAAVPQIQQNMPQISTSE